MGTVDSNTYLSALGAGTKAVGAYNAADDCGVLWSGFGFSWPCAAPILSERDRGFPALADFASPFSGPFSS